MKLQAEDLHPPNYTLLDTLEHQDIVPFMQKYIRKKTISAIFYYAFCSMSLGVTGAYAAVLYFSKGFSGKDVFFHISLGCLLPFLLIPLHEFLHALAYKWVGASNTSYDVNWKQFYFMATADKFVANRQEFLLVAWLPFSVISLLSFLLCWALPPLWGLTMAMTISIHAAFCSGDFALISYFEFHKDKEVLTFDDTTNKVSYFYVKEK
jgi:hypothetical protein